MQRQSSKIATASVLAALVGDECYWFETGTVARAEFKSDDAVVCDECGTPAVRVW